MLFDKFQTIRSFSVKFWFLNIIQMIERLAYWIVVLQMPIYIAQKDIPGGLGWDQALKGVIYFWWAFMQNAVPLIAGGYADRYGRKTMLIVSFVFIIAGYLILGSTTDFSYFLLGVIILGFGSGIFKPTIQGSIASSLNFKNSAIGWGLYVMLINFAVFFGPPISIILKNITWQMVFYGAAAIFVLNFPVLYIINDFQSPVPNKEFSGIKVLKKTFKGLFTAKIGFFVLFMSGFTIIYMQFYETLPNFIYDWSDTSSIVNFLKPDSHFTMETGRGTMLTYEWLYNINAGFVIIGVVFFSYIMKKINLKISIIIGIITATFGLYIAGFSYSGYFLVAGMMIYTVGEMIANPRFTEYMGSIAPTNDKSLYMGYMSISWTIGLAGGGVIGGYLYKHLGEKAGFALDYIHKHYPEVNANINNAFIKLTKLENISQNELTVKLWEIYNPFYVWIPFVIIGLISVIGLIVYHNKFKNS